MASAGAQPAVQPTDEQRLEILTPERVALGYELAGIGSRGAAALIDTFLQLLAGLVLGIVTLVVAGLIGSATDDIVFAIFLAVMVVGWFVVLLGYFMLFEAVWSGQTPGKRMLGIRVIRENGYPVRVGDAVVRNLMRIIDALPTAYLVGIVSILLSRRSKRLGDFVAGTVVVRERAALNTNSLSFTPDSAMPSVRLRDQDEQLVRGYLARRGLMSEPARLDLARRIADGVARRNGLQADLDAAPSADVFLERLV